MDKLVKQVREYISGGVYDPSELFNLLNTDFPRKHYSTLRKAVHIAKSSIYG